MFGIKVSSPRRCNVVTSNGHAVSFKNENEIGTHLNPQVMAILNHVVGTVVC